MSPNDPASVLSITVILITCTTVVGMLYTVSFLLYCLCIRLLYSQIRNLDGKIERHTLWTLIFVSAVMTCATIDMVSLNLYSMGIYGDPSNGAAGEAELPRIPATLLVDDITSLVEMTLTLGVLLWRVRTIWDGTRFVVPITAISLLLYLGSVGTFIGEIIIGWFHPGSNPLHTRGAITDHALIAASLIFMTSMIITRLMLVRREVIRLIGKSVTAVEYWGITAMLVESYALNTAWYIGLMICVILNATPGINFFNFSIAQVDALVYFLLVYRVYSGRAWDKQTFSRLSTLQWPPDNQPGDATTGAATFGTVHV